MSIAKTFPVERGLQGINHLAIFLNSLGLKGQWHFASGTRSTQPLIHVDFDDPSDAEPAWQKYQDAYAIDPTIPNVL